MKFFNVASDEIQSLVKAAIERWHPDLKESGAIVLAIMVESDDDKPAINHEGYPVLACITVVRQSDRATKQHDAELFINGDAWESMTSDQRMALLDHELSHLKAKVKRQKRTYAGPAIIERDQYGRPKLGLVKGDWNVGDGFKEVVERHGLAAAEFENIRRAYAFAQSIVKG